MNSGPVNATSDLLLTAIDLTRACCANDNYLLWLSHYSDALHGSAGIANYLANAAVAFEEQAHPQPASFLNNRHRTYSTERVIEPLVLPSQIQELEDLTGYFVASGKVVRIAFDVAPKRVLAPGLIERMIPNVQTRPLDPEPAGKPEALHPTRPDDQAAGVATASAFN